VKNKPETPEVKANLVEPVKPAEVKTKAAKPEKKRGHYAQKECPYCHKHFGNVKNHILLVHKVEAEADGRLKELTKEDLIKTGPKQPAPLTPEDKIYYCIECRAKLRKGENPCWHCGAQLIWEGIE